MPDVSFTLFCVQVLINGFTLILACFYSITIVFTRRLRDRLNIFTLNLCLANIVCCLFWFVFDLLSEFSPQQVLRKETCRLVIYAQIMATLHLPLAFVVVSIHRCCSIISHSTPFFKSNRWMTLCLVSQWSMGFLLPLIVFSETAVGKNETNLITYVQSLSSRRVDRPNGNVSMPSC